MCSELLLFLLPLYLSLSSAWLEVARGSDRTISNQRKIKRKAGQEEDPALLLAANHSFELTNQALWDRKCDVNLLQKRAGCRACGCADEELPQLARIGIRGRTADGERLRHQIVTAGIDVLAQHARAIQQVGELVLCSELQLDRHRLILNRSVSAR